ncbi:MAG TPA: Os1348 family NHLP clan protein [Candidatus Polarisedimenticolia bacterium]|nr:Os1348 family NHLP clan protein [Candidatus Polarisedimenticolia bacterium]
MSQRNVELFVGRLMTDEAFRERFCREPAQAVGLLAREGIELTCVEIEALSKISPALAKLFAEALDPRIQKVCPGGRAH